MLKTIPPLKKGDLIHILAPAKAIGVEAVVFAKTFLENKGFQVSVSIHCTDQHNYFSARLNERLEDFQNAIDDANIKAVLCARGGYGCIQLVDKLDWSPMISNPKWILGFSDVTVFHHRMAKLQLPSIHSTMPLNFENNSSQALDTLVSALKGEAYSISCPPSDDNKFGETKGKLIGGNLSIIFSLMGTNDQYDFTGSILFIEDLDEQIYHLDRMMYALEKAGVLKQISGLIVGGMTDMKDTAVPFGKNYREIILSHFHARNIPVCFDFPAGHINDNRALVFGKTVQLKVNKHETLLSF